MSRILDVLLAVLYPPRCALCGRERSRPSAPRLCGRCLRELGRLSDPCPRCAEPATAPLCDRCRTDPPPFTLAAACWPYREGGALAEALGRWKYGRDLEIGDALARHFAERLHPPAPCYDQIVPVPLHPARLRARGFNQAAVLAARLRSARPTLGPLALRALARASSTRAQAGLARGGRQRNVRGAFRAPRTLTGRRILLVDDVLTTTATAAACTRALLGAGAREVHVVALARTPRPAGDR